MRSLSGSGVRYDQAMSSTPRPSSSAVQYSAVPLYGHIDVVVVGSSRSRRTSTLGMYHRGGSPVSNNTRACVVSASTTPSSSTRIALDDGRMSMRLYGSRGCTKTSSSSSNQASIACQSSRTASRSSSIGELGYRIAALGASASPTLTV